MHVNTETVTDPLVTQTTIHVGVKNITSSFVKFARFEKSLYNKLFDNYFVLFSFYLCTVNAGTEKQLRD